MGGAQNGNGTHRDWADLLAPSTLLEVEDFPDSADDGYPWALQQWDAVTKTWEWIVVGVVPLHRSEADLERDARQLSVHEAARYVWVRHWSPDRDADGKGWRACIDTRKTIGPIPLE